MNGLLLNWHLGAGDMIICNAIVRHLATQYDIICLPVKHHNVASATYLFRDLTNVLIRGVVDDAEQLMLRDVVWKGAKLGLGMFSDKPFKGAEFDQEFYRQMGLPFEQRWSGWKCERDDESRSVLFPLIAKPYAVVHDDLKRGFVIPSERLPNIDHFRPHGLNSIFGYWRMIERADEIHVINSSFALFVDSIDLPNKPKLFLHLYARQHGEVPTFRKDWIRLT